MAKGNGVSINPKAYSATWKEKDEALLIDLLQRKIHEMRFEMSEASSPYERASLKAKRKEYRSMLEKVRSGHYNGNIIMSELSSAVSYQNHKQEKKATVLSKYVSSYDDVDFDFESYFGKTRYYGMALPIVIMVFMLIFIGVITMGAFVPATTIESFESSLSSDDFWMSVTNVGYMKLDDTTNDFRIPNDGSWPKGRWAEVLVTEEYTPIKNAAGDPVLDANGAPIFAKKTLDTANQYKKSCKPEGAFFTVDTWVNAYDASNSAISDGNNGLAWVKNSVKPETVYLYRDLGMLAIDITAFDVMRAVFRTPMFASQRVDFIEDMEVMSGRSWYYLRYMRDRADSIKIERGLDGKYDSVAIVKYFATYGIMYSMWLAVFFALVSIIFCIFRLFSYTSRKFHVFTFLTFVFALVSFVLPAFLEIKGVSGEAMSDAFKNYFIFSIEGFRTGTSLLMGNVVFAGLSILPLIALFLPFIFKNRARTNVFVVPKGNKPPRADLVKRPIVQGVPTPYNAAPRR